MTRDFYRLAYGHLVFYHQCSFEPEAREGFILHMLAGNTEYALDSILGEGKFWQQGGEWVVTFEEAIDEENEFEVHTLHECNEVLKSAAEYHRSGSVVSFSELREAFLKVERGEDPVTPVRDPQAVFAGNVIYRAASGWDFAVFSDCNVWDYIDHAITPDGRKIDFNQIPMDDVPYEPTDEVAWKVWGIPGYRKGKGTIPKWPEKMRKPMKLNTKTKEFFAEVYDILIEHADAPSGPHNKSDFIYLEMEGCDEWRFQGSLGFGGKFWCLHDRVDVTYNKEDKTLKRETTVKTVNELLRQLVQRHQGTE